MSSVIDQTASISNDASLASDVVVGPYVVIGSGVTIGAGTVIGPHVRIDGPCTIGERNQFVGSMSIGTPPQDLKFGGERTELVIGNDNVFREFVTVNRGTVGGGGRTSIGSNNFIMSYSHIAHDCHIGSYTIFANNATLAGHVEVGDHATVGALTAVHQFARIGEHAFIGGGTLCTMDCLPFIKTVGARPAKTYGINTIGLQRKGFSEAAIAELNQVYRILFRSKLNTSDALARARETAWTTPEAAILIGFIESSTRGFIR
jgi:UDP-N-acetylglucosamine acyltransferase